MKVRAKPIDGRLALTIPELYAAHLKLQPGTLLELRATRDGFLVRVSKADDSPSGDERARERAKSRVPTGVDVARALGGPPRPNEDREIAAPGAIEVDAANASALRSIVDRYEGVLRGLPT